MTVGPLSSPGPASLQASSSRMSVQGPARSLRTAQRLIGAAANNPTRPSGGAAASFMAALAGSHRLGSIDPHGWAQPMQGFLGRTHIGSLNFIGNGSGITVIGLSNNSNTGTATTRNVATTNFFTRLRRLGFVSAATAASVAGIRVGTQHLTMGNGAGGGGFLIVGRFGISDAVLVATARMFIGIRQSTGAPADADPQTLTNSIGVGHDTGETTLRFYCSGAVAQAEVDLGANFPVNTINTDLYELALYSPSRSNGTLHWMVTRVNTGHVASGVVQSTDANVTPILQVLTPINAWRSNGAAGAAAVGVDFVNWHVETEN